MNFLAKFLAPAIQYRWILIAALFFVAFKVVLITIMWHDRSLPPEPDDSLIYSGHIAAIKHCPQLVCAWQSLPISSQEKYLSYSLTFGLIARVFHLSPLAVYHASFYVGIMLLVPALVLLLHSFTLPQKPIALALLTLALYSGGGRYHGFFWVVPTFFAVLLFFVLLALVLHQRWSLIWLVPLLPVYIFTHPLSIYFLLILPLSLGIYAGLSRSFPRLLVRRTVLLLTAAIITYLTGHHLISGQEPASSPIISSPAPITSLAEVSRDDALSPSLPASTDWQADPIQVAKRLRAIKHDYYNWIIPHPLGLLLPIIFLAVLMRARQYQLLSLFIATILFTLLSTVAHPEGYRALVMLWPVTLMFYAVGFWYTFVYLRYFVRKPWQTIWLGLSMSALLGFLGINLMYSIAVAQYMSVNKNLRFPDEYIDYLAVHTPNNEPIQPITKLVASYHINTPLISRPLANERGKSKYYVNLRQPSSEAPGPRILLEELTAIGIVALRGVDRFQPPLVGMDQRVDLIDHSVLRQLVLEKEFGLIAIYRNLIYD